MPMVQRVLTLFVFAFGTSMMLQGCGGDSSTTASPATPSPGSTHSMSTVTTTSTIDDSPIISQHDLEVACPSYVVDCGADGPCDSAWNCMADASRCNGFAKCLEEAATVAAPTEPMEEMAGCLSNVCTNATNRTSTTTIVSTSAGGTNGTTAIVTTSAAGPHASQQDLVAQCPEVVGDCQSDSFCLTAWECMAGVNDCIVCSECLSDAATVHMADETIEEMAGCLDTVCTAPQMTTAAPMRSSQPGSSVLLA